METKKFKTENYILVPGFAITELGLSGNELLCYSLVYGFTQDRETEFAGSLNYVASALNVTKRNAKGILDRLVEKGLISKRAIIVEGVRLCRYQIDNTPVVKTTTPPLSEQQHPVDEMTTNNTIYNLFDNAESILSPKDISPKHFQKPLIAEIKAYCIERNNGIDAQTFYDYYESIGWMIGKKKMKDWRAAVRTWERKTKEYNNNGIYQSRQRQDNRRETPAPNPATVTEADMHF